MAVKGSLSFRLLASVSVAVAIFLGLTGIALDKAFRDSARAAVMDRLQGQIYALLSSADLNVYDQMVMPEVLADERYASPASGIYASLAGRDIEWRSPSALGMSIPWQPGLEPGEQVFQGPLATESGEIYLMGFGVAWELPDGNQRAYTFSAAESAAGYHAQISQFRRSLWGWLAAAAIVLLMVQVIVLRWGLSPLRRVAEEIRVVEGGAQEQLSTDYPKELSGLTQNLNALIASERRSLERYRHSLADLAHSLKTPLTVIRSSAEELSEDDKRAEILTHTERMNELVAYQLRRASAAGSRTLSRPIPVQETAEQLLAAMRKVHRSRGVEFELEVEPGACFRGERGDLMELLGNLLDNAGKWAKSRVVLKTGAIINHGTRIPGLWLRVEDDGPGIAPESRAKLTQRGVRGDERVEGQGIGLAIVTDLVAAHDGELEIGDSDLGGACITVKLPPLE